MAAAAVSTAPPVVASETPSSTPENPVEPVVTTTTKAKAVKKTGTGIGRKVMKKGTSISRSARAGLVFPVGRLSTRLRKARVTPRVAGGAPVYLAAVLEYLAAEVLETAGNVARDNKRKRIIPRHIQLAVRNDGELNKLLSHVTIPSGGVLPNIHNVLLRKKKGVDNEETPNPTKGVVSKPAPKPKPAVAAKKKAPVKATKAAPRAPAKNKEVAVDAAAVATDTGNKASSNEEE